MSAEVPVEVLPPETPMPHSAAPEPLPHARFSRKRVVLAFTVAALADGLSIFLTLTPPVQWAADLVTAVLLFLVLGRQWILLPGLIMEAVPGLYVFPFWVLVVGAVSVWGTAPPASCGSRWAGTDREMGAWPGGEPVNVSVEARRFVGGSARRSFIVSARWSLA